MRYRYSDDVNRPRKYVGGKCLKNSYRKKEEKENVIKQILYKATNEAIILRSTSAR